METYNGHVRTPADAIILFEACRIGLLPRVQRRLSEKERQSIKSGSVFVWDEREAGMRRWTDGKSWSASRVSGSFLTYREMEGKRGGSNFDKNNANRDGMHSGDPDSDGGPDGYRYKPDGLMKQSFSITTNNGQHLHLISYFSRSSAASQNLMQPTNDPQLRHIRPEKGMYPESTVHEQSSIPAVTRGPMSSPGYVHSPHQSPYGRPPPYGYGPGWAPPSPMHTPPPHPHYSPYYGQPHSAHPGYGTSPLQNMHYPHPQQYGPPQGMTAFDRPPPHLANPGLPPPPPHSYAQMPPYQPNGYSSAYGQGYQAPYQSYQPPPLQAPPYPPPQQQPQQPPYSAPTLPRSENTNLQKDDRQDSHQTESSQQQPQDSQSQPSAPNSANPSTEHQASAGAIPPSSSGQTIPSIHAMLNSGPNGQPPARTSSRSPNGTVSGPSDIPSHKLGFEVNRDMQALRNLDKTTFKGY